MVSVFITHLVYFGYLYYVGQITRMEIPSPLNGLDSVIPGGGGGGGTWVFRGVHTFVIKIKLNTPKALISGQKSTLILIKR